MMKFKTRVIALAVAVICAALFVAYTTTSAAQQEDQPATTTQTTTVTSSAPAPRPPRNGCHRLYSRRFYETYAEMVYAGQKRLNRHRAARLVLLERCQHDARSQRWAYRTRRSLSAQNRYRRRALCGTPTCNRVLGMRMAVDAYGRGAGGCVDFIVRHEGGWDGVQRYNTQGSGAYGIGQALPASKMRAFGRDYMTNVRTQLRWLLSYVRMYGGICGAAAHWTVAHSY